MKVLSIWLSLLLWLCPRLSSGQELSFTHYDIPEGLASSTVYCITQDTDGFIWLGTEAGVCRFDGKHFLTFTTADGLPDAEVLQMFGDSRGRVWMAPFKGSICYYYRGQFHNPGNDTVLASVRVRQLVENFAEDATGNIMITEHNALHVIQPDGRVRNYDSAAGKPIDSCTTCCRNRAGHFAVHIGSGIFELLDTGFRRVERIHYIFDNPVYMALSPSWAAWRADTNQTAIQSLTSGEVTRIPFYPGGNVHYSHVSYSIVGDSSLFSNQFSGTLEYDLYRTAARRRLLSGRKVSRVFGDRAGNLWFTTLGNGIYRLNTADFKTIHFPDAGISQSSITFIGPNLKGDGLIAGNDHNAVFDLSLPDLRIVDSHPIDNYYAANRVLFARQLSAKTYLYGTDGAVFLGGRFVYIHGNLAGGIKSASPMDDHRLLIGGYWGAAIYDIKQTRITEQLWNSRISAVYSKNDTNYIGTLNGLWMLREGKSPQYLGKTVDFFRNRIVAMTESEEGVLWVASYDAGLIGYKNGRVVAEITKKQGLIGNVCHCLFLYHDVLWVGTDKGLNKVLLREPGYPISFFNSIDGLASDVVNVVYAMGSRIYVGTAAGLTYFDESKAVNGDECGLVLDGIISSGHNRIGDSADLVLPVKQNDIRFEFTGISYRSAGRINYRYRLIGLDSVWRETQDGYLAYPTLPSGRYEFQVQAINRFGIRSGVRSASFEVATPYWKQIWFLGLLLVLFFSAVWLVVNWRIRRIRMNQEQAAMQVRRMAELKHIALQSQMNPHFIFNCLNSIQQFVFDKDMMATNEYISGFARLIRATLNNSSRPFIAVSEEIDYLSDYLSLEQMRFKKKLDYRIEVDPNIDIHRNLLPPMLLQPYVENSVRHGLRHKTAGQGYVYIHFSQNEDRIIVIIRDNGIGRKKARDYKTAEHIEYQSKGMSLTMDRIQVIRTLYDSHIEVRVDDMVDSAGLSEGTQVEIRFPFFSEGLRQA